MLVHWILIALAVAVRSDDECTNRNIGDCWDITDNAISELNGHFPSAEYLDKHCSRFSQALTCLQDLEQKCSAASLDITPGFTQGMEGIISLLCDEDSEIRKGYLENLECYDDSMFKVTECESTKANIADDLQKRVQNKTEFRHPYALTCMVVPFFTNCVAKAMSGRCGCEEARPVKGIFRRFFSSLMKHMCPADLLPIWQEEFETYVEENGIALKKWVYRSEMSTILVHA